MAVGSDIRLASQERGKELEAERVKELICRPYEQKLFHEKRRKGR